MRDISFLIELLSELNKITFMSSYHITWHNRMWKHSKNIATVIPPTINKLEMLKRLQGVVKRKGSC
jgi:hypothetical protein